VKPEECALKIKSQVLAHGAISATRNTPIVLIQIAQEITNQGWKRQEGKRLLHELCAMRLVKEYAHCNHHDKDRIFMTGIGDDLP